MRFARVTEEVYQRRHELIDKDRKQGYKETLLLYQMILLHSWGTGKCEKTLPELCDIYNLEYHNSTRRLKILREKKWVEDTDKYIRPLLVHRPEKKKDVKNTPTDSPYIGVNSTSDSSVKITPLSVKITPNECKNYTKNGENSVNFTPQNAETPYSQKDSGDANTFFKSKTFLEAPAATEPPSAAAAETNNKSQFSLEECLRWAKFCVERGDNIRNPEGLARRAHQTGDEDAFIYAALYPEGLDKGGNVVLKRLSQERLEYYVKSLQSLSEAEFDPEEWRHDFHRDDWEYLMRHRNG